MVRLKENFYSNRQGISVIEILMSIGILSLLTLLIPAVFQSVDKGTSKDKIRNSIVSLESLVVAALEDPSNYVNLNTNLGNGSVIPFSLGNMNLGTYNPAAPTSANEFDLSLRPCAPGSGCPILLQFDVYPNPDAATVGEFPILISYRISANPNRANPISMALAGIGADLNPDGSLVRDPNTGANTLPKGQFRVSSQLIATADALVDPAQQSEDYQCNEAEGETFLKGLVYKDGQLSPLCWQEPAASVFYFKEAIPAEPSISITPSAVIPSSDNDVNAVFGSCPAGSFPTGVRTGDIDNSMEDTDTLYFLCEEMRVPSCQYRSDALAAINPKDFDARLNASGASKCTPAFADTINIVTPLNSIPADPLTCFEVQNNSEKIRYTKASGAGTSCNLDYAFSGLDSIGTRDAIFVSGEDYIDLLSATRSMASLEEYEEAEAAVLWDFHDDFLVDFEKKASYLLTTSPKIATVLSDISDAIDNQESRYFVEMLALELSDEIEKATASPELIELVQTHAATLIALSRGDL